jgi:hypothetical protein
MDPKIIIHIINTLDCEFCSTVVFDEESNCGKLLEQLHIFF